MKDQNTYFLVKSIKKGNLSSLEKLYSLFYSKLYWFAKKFNSPTLEPDDFVQQTFLRLWENRDKLKEDVLIDKQIYTICRNIILNHLKRESKLVPTEEKNFFGATEIKENTGQDEINLEWLYSVLKSLLNKRREVFVLHKIENLSYEEIAASLNISKKTIANHIYLAQNHIKQELEKEKNKSLWQKLFG